jgi:hypothetical protein
VLYLRSCEREILTSLAKPYFGSPEHMHVLVEGDQAPVSAQGVNLQRVFHRQDYERARLIGGVGSRLIS